MGKSKDKNISKSLNDKYSQKFYDHAKQFITDALKKTAEATGDLIGNKITNRISRVLKNSQQNNSEIDTNEHDK